MKAIIYRGNGGPDVLELVEREQPVPGPGEVRVRVAVSGVNPTDWQARSSPAVEDVAAAVRDGALPAGEEHGLPLIRFPLNRTADAHRAVESGAVGKVLVDITP